MLNTVLLKFLDHKTVQINNTVWQLANNSQT